MTDILIFACVMVFNSLVIVGLWTDSDYEENVDESKMIFWKVKKWIVETFGTFWSKPLITCPPCMASIHSLYIFFPFGLHYGWNLHLWPLYVLALSALNRLIASRFNG